MDSKTEELLCMLLWAGDMLARPTFRNLTDSFESWAYRNGFLRQLQRLEKQSWLESREAGTKDRLYRLTEAGRLAALGGRDPEANWNRRWDRYWRLVLFDVPEAKGSARNRLRNFLRQRGFGYLQNSVWITPHPIVEERAILMDGPVNVESFVVLEARPCAGENDSQIVAGAWDFAAINQRHQTYQDVLAKIPRRPLHDENSASAFHRWLRVEREAWLDAIERDPLLPDELLPPDYLGRVSWQKRLAVMTKVGEAMRDFDASRSRQ
jgi:phenylacetic acid degradation operon negative regulatory protein